MRQLQYSDGYSTSANLQVGKVDPVAASRSNAIRANQLLNLGYPLSSEAGNRSLICRSRTCGLQLNSIPTLAGTGSTFPTCEFTEVEWCSILNGFQLGQ
jgi:hypothetical protein